jgi:hypothetical protein
MSGLLELRMAADHAAEVLARSRARAHASNWAMS